MKKYCLVYIIYFLFPKELSAQNNTEAIKSSNLIIGNNLEFNPKESKFIGKESEGLRSAEYKGKLCFIDSSNKIIIPPIYFYDSTEIEKPFFREGYSLLSKDFKCFEGVIDNANNIIVPFDVTSTSRGNFGFEVYKDGKYGMYDFFGNNSIPIIYETLYNPYIYNDFFFVSLNKKYGLIDKNNKTLLPLIYDRLYEFPGADAFISEINGIKKAIKIDGSNFFKNEYVSYNQLEIKIMSVMKDSL